MKNKKSKFGLIILLVLIVGIVYFFLLSNDENINDNTGINYSYTPGLLNRIVDETGTPKQNEFIIDGLILIGNSHSYVDSEETENVISYFENIGYLTKNINSTFYLGESIDLFVKTDYSFLDDEVKVLVVPHNKITKYEKMSFEDLSSFALEKGSVLSYEHSEYESPNYIGQIILNDTLSKGKYDILFTYKEEIAYFIAIELDHE